MRKHRLRSGLPELPPQVAALPRDKRGYPVPWFVAWIDGVPDFRVIGPGKILLAVKERRCWVCGQRLGPLFAFVIGPMCAVNRISSEPPSHLECAEFSARACPFLSRPHMVRRGGGMPDLAATAPGHAITRNPGVALVWITRRYQVVPVERGVLFRVGAPQRLHAYAEGRAATPKEIRASVDLGLPQLRALAAEEGPEAIAALEAEVRAARKVLGIGREEVQRA